MLRQILAFGRPEYPVGSKTLECFWEALTIAQNHQKLWLENWEILQLVHLVINPPIANLWFELTGTIFGISHALEQAELDAVDVDQQGSLAKSICSECSHRRTKSAYNFAGKNI